MENFDFVSVNSYGPHVIKGGCGIPINRTFAMIILPNWLGFLGGCLDAISFDFQTNSWSNYQHCFHHFGTYEFVQRPSIKCTSYFDKYGKM